MLFLLRGDFDIILLYFMDDTSTSWLSGSWLIWWYWDRLLHNMVSFLWLCIWLSCCNDFLWFIMLVCVGEEDSMALLIREYPAMLWFLFTVCFLTWVYVCSNVDVSCRHRYQVTAPPACQVWAYPNLIKSCWFRDSVWSLFNHHSSLNEYPIVARCHCCFVLSCQFFQCYLFGN